MIKSFKCGCVVDTKNIDIYNLPECKETWQMLSSGNVKGIFQVESYLGKDWIQKLQPNSKELLSALIAIIRPGVLNATDENGDSMTKVFCKRRHGDEFEYIDKSIEEILAPTYGVLIYQEQMMKIAQVLCGFDLKETDDLRKAAGKKSAKLMHEIRTKFVSKAIEKGIVTEEQATKIYDNIEKSARYLFNKCVRHDTKIRNGFRYNNLTVEEMYNIRNDISYAKRTGHISLYKKWKLLKSYGCGLSIVNGRIKLNKIIDIRYEGIKDIYRIELESGAFLECTNNHKFPTETGEKQLQDIKVGDVLFYCGKYEKNTEIYSYSDTTIADLRSITKNYKNKGFPTGSSNPGYTNGSYSEFEKNKKLLPQHCQICGKTANRLECHHINGDRTNSKIDNLMNLCVSCHKKEEYKAGRTKIGEKGYPILTSKVKSITYLGQDRVYDVEMEAPSHTFVTNSEIITCNSHSNSYAETGYITAWLKYHFPLKFYIGWLSQVNEDQDPKQELRELVQDARMNGVTINVPNLLDRKANTYIKDGEIYLGIGNIKSLGEKSVQKILSQVTPTMGWLDMLYAFTPKQLELLVQSGATGGNRVRKLAEIQAWGSLTKNEQSFIKKQGEPTLAGALEKYGTTKKSGGCCANESRADTLQALAWSLKKPPSPLNDTPVVISKFEIDMLGVQLTCTKSETVDRRLIDSTIKDVQNGKKNGLLAVEISNSKVIRVKNGVNKGRMMAFVKVYDITGEIEGTIFPDQFDIYSPYLIKGNVIVIKYYSKDGKSLIINDVWQG